MIRAVQVETATLTGKALNWAVASALGWKWARNACRRRSGDVFAQYSRPQATPSWPIGSLCFVAPSRNVNLHATEVNWDGWLLPQGDEALAPAAFESLPNFCESWEHADELFRYIHFVEDKGQSRFCAGVHRYRVFKDLKNGGWDYSYGETQLIAVCRVIVTAFLGNKALVPKELL